MTIIEYTPQNLSWRIQHKRKIRRMVDGIMPRNFERVILALAALCVIFFAFCIAVWWNEGAMAEEYDYNTYVRVVNAENGLRVRRGPGTDYYAAYMIGNGFELVLKDTRPGWALVASAKYPDKPFGWVCSDYLEVLH